MSWQRDFMDLTYFIRRVWILPASQWKVGGTTTNFIWQKKATSASLTWTYLVWEPEISTSQLFQCNSLFDPKHNVFLWVSIASCTQTADCGETWSNIKYYQRSRVQSPHNHWWSTLTSLLLMPAYITCLPDYDFIRLICKFKQMCFWLALIHHWCQISERMKHMTFFGFRWVYYRFMGKWWQ